MKKNLNFLNKVFVIKKPYNRQNESQFVYFSNGYIMIWCPTDFYVRKLDSNSVIDIFQFNNGIANHEQLNDRIFLENAIHIKYSHDTSFATALLKSNRSWANNTLYCNNKLDFDYNLAYNLGLINHFLKSNYTYISPTEYKRLDKKLLDIIKYQVNRLDKGQELVENYNEYLKLI